MKISVYFAYVAQEGRQRRQVWKADADSKWVWERGRVKPLSDLTIIISTNSSSQFDKTEPAYDHLLLLSWLTGFHLMQLAVARKY